MIDLDVHTHLVPIHPARLAGFDQVRWLEDERVLVLDGERLDVPRLFQPDKLVEWMDLRGVRRALVSIPPPVYRQTLDATRARGWVDYLNEELLAITQASHGRLGALYYLPLEHPGLLLPLMDKYGDAFEGVAIAAGGHARIVYSDPCYTALWERLHELGAFVFMHPGMCRDARLAPFYLHNFLGNPYETGVAAAHLVMAGLPARYSGIRFCLAHAGGIFAALCGRLEKGFETNRPGVDTELERPLATARRFRVDCIAHHPSALQLARDVVGSDQVLFGSDWPFPMGIDDPSTVDRPS